MNDSNKKNIFIRIAEGIENVRNSINELSRTNKTLSIIIGILLTVILLFEGINKFLEFKEHLPQSKTSIEFRTNDENTLKVLILPFKNYDNSNFEIEQIITDKLDEKKEKENLNIEVLYDSLSKPVNTFKDAEIVALKKKNIPDIVMFGELEGKNFKTKILNLNQEEYNKTMLNSFIQNKIEGKYIKNTSAKKIKELDLISNQEFIIYKLLFYSAIKNKDCIKANRIIDYFIPIINKNSNLKYELEELALDLAICYQYKEDIDDALRIINWNILNFPNSNESRMFKVGLLMNNLYLTEDKKNIFNKIQNELSIIKRDENDLESIPYLFSGYLYLLNKNYKYAIKEFEYGRKVEVKDSFVPISKFVLNILKGNFKKNITLFDSINNNSKDFEIGRDAFYAIHHILDGSLEKTIDDISKMYKHKLITNEDDKIGIEYIKTILNNMVNNFDINIDSTYISLHKNFSKNAEQNLKDALLLALLIRKKNDLKIINNHIKIAIKNNPDYAKYFNFNNLPKDSVIILKNRISNNKDSILNNPNNYKALSFLSNDYKKLGYDFVSKYYSQKALKINLKSLLFLDNTNITNKEKDSLREIYTHYDNLLKNFSANSDNQNAIAYQKIAMVLKKFDILDYSREYYLKSINIDSTCKESYISLAHIEFLNKEYSKAIYYDKKYIEIDSTYYISYLNLGSDYYHLQKYDSAIYQIKKAINHYNKKRNDKYTIKDLEKYIHISEEKMKTTPNKM